MTRFGLFGTALSCVALLVGSTNADETEKPITIPLDQIWAFRMPGTKDIAALEPDNTPKVEHGHLVGEIRRALANVPPKGSTARACFAVVGTGLEALRAAHAVLVDNVQPAEEFRKGDEICVVFLSYQFGKYVHLKNVERRGSLFEVQYEFVPHRTEQVTEHFALVPLGPLPSGEYRVTVSQQPMRKEYIVAGFKPVSDADAKRIVCHSFSFAVTNTEDQ